MLIIQGKFIPVTVEQIILDLRATTGLFKDINDVGDNLMVTCPKHSGGQERNPSCGILKEDKEDGNRLIKAGKVHCYTCNYTDTIEGLVSYVKGYQTAQEGLYWILNNYTGNNIERRKRPKIPLNLERRTKKEEVVKIPTKTVKQNTVNFNNSPRAIKYMESRGISKGTCNKYKIGYNIDNDSIMFPITDAGKVVMYKERFITKKIFLNQKGGLKGAYIFGLDEIMSSTKGRVKYVWVCESEIDALTLAEEGHNAIAIMGNQISDDQVSKLLRTPIRRLIDGLDRDEAGRKGYEVLKRKTIPYGFRIYDTDWRGLKGKDINDLSKKDLKTLLKRLDKQ